MGEHFKGDQKHLDHVLLQNEKRLLNFLLPFVPSWISTVHLTLMTIVWASLIVLFGYLANTNIIWLLGFNACIFLQYVTDMLDGAVGRQRNEGLIKWGFYMDHFLDYVFLCSIIIGYSFLLPSSYLFLVLSCLAITGGFMVHVLMDFAITSDFKISFNHFGVSEVRILLILFNFSLIYLGKMFFVQVFPWVVLCSLLALVVMVYQSQKIYASIDMQEKKNS